MSWALSFVRWTGAEQAEPAARALAPDVLRQAGVLGDPHNPQDAVKRARAFIQQGLYNEARDLLVLHLDNPVVGGLVLELLAQCAMRTGAEDAEPCAQQALAIFTARGDREGQARVRRLLGEMMLAQGQLEEAEELLRWATKEFTLLGNRSAAASASCDLALVQLRWGLVANALAEVDAALAVLLKNGTPHAIALARVARARILAAQGENGKAARELLAAEPILAAGGSVSERMDVRLARAEGLLQIGHKERAARGLSRLLVDVVDLEDVYTQSQVSFALGQALLDSNPAAARRQLTRCRQQFVNMNLEYFVAATDLCLARAEWSLGQDASSRLAGFHGGLARWPLLEAELQMTRLDLTVGPEFEMACAALMRIRTAALAHGNVSLARGVARKLQLPEVGEEAPKTALLAMDEESLVPEVSGPSLASTGRPTLSLAPLQADECMRTPHDREANDLVRVRIENRTAPSLTPPRRVGVRRATG